MNAFEYVDLASNPGSVFVHCTDLGTSAAYCISALEGSYPWSLKLSLSSSWKFGIFDSLVSFMRCSSKTLIVHGKSTIPSRRQQVDNDLAYGRAYSPRYWNLELGSSVKLHRWAPKSWCRNLPASYISPGEADRAVRRQQSIAWESNRSAPYERRRKLNRASSQDS